MGIEIKHTCIVQLKDIKLCDLLLLSLKRTKKCQVSLVVKYSLAEMVTGCTCISN